MSRELDIEVIKTLFGVKRVYCRYGQPWDEAMAEHESDRPFYIPSGKPWRTHSIDAIPVPRYSQDIAAAMVVVEHMRSEWWVKMWEPATGMWAATFADHQADSRSLPEAICRAALEALAAVRGAADGEVGA